jgi:hypothetical protein
MAILERLSFRVINDQWDSVMAQEKEWEALESKIGGFPMKRRFRAYTGSLSTEIFVFEREWESMAAYEAAYHRLFAMPEVKPLAAAAQTTKADQRIEFYGVLTS